MVPELEKPRITEIQVRMDCNGCIQKIKKALHGINGIYDLYIDYPQQKLTVVGWADPEKIVKAIKKTRKSATICAHREPSEPPSQPSEPAPPEGGGQPAPDATKPPPAESPPNETVPPPEPPKDLPPPENPAPETTPSSVAADTAAPLQIHNHSPKDFEDVHIIHHHPHDYGYGYSNGGHWNNYPTGHGFRLEPPVYVTHSYNTCKPSTSTSETHSYNTHKPSPSISEYEYIRSPPRHNRYSQTEHYSEDYHNHGNSDGNNITSMFSDENPNACRIV
ncbi:leucine-rich repeat extensin-like protein 3 [Macadamia integrifolia]|uniref:leucine-rich repeat extensin-like protein 3 n=1 Tax=Macadamia integrifolia TaxID=60698 RepID=UPI001C4EFD40|nr:leucine-rich repeat extensin-like protein 3 [Macadamia integrifolia]